MAKSAAETSPVTRALEILTPASGSSVGPGVFIYNHFTKADDMDRSKDEGANSSDAPVAVHSGGCRETGPY